jgi:Fungal specific transcription factor domain/Fungal Zn(2)-Cys(6) binuclear cluster domain
MDPPRISEAQSVLPHHSPTQGRDSNLHDLNQDDGHDGKKKRKRSSLVNASDGDPYSELDSILSQKRKPRNKTACIPCRKRKVGCDKTSPCQTCIERRHPELCVYESTNDIGSPFMNMTSIVSPSPSEHVSVPKNYLDMLMSKVDQLEHSLRELRSELGTVLAQGNGMSKSPAIDPLMTQSNEETRSEDAQRREGIHTNNPITGQIIHVGGNSVPALLMSLAKHQSSQNADQLDWNELVNGSILPLLGLDNETATYPFIDLWAIPEPPLQKVKRIAEVLPGNDEIGRLWQPYKAVAQTIFPAIGNVTKFENELGQFRIRRAQESPEDGITEQTIYGKKICWVGLLFAVLASGCHFSEHLDRSSRELTSKVFICCSFECLRLTNFLSSPSAESIQALAIFLNVLLNMYNAGVSWAMLGLAIRLGQSLGLHRQCPPTTPLDRQNERGRIWWALMWQDSIISVTYDRAGSALNYDGHTHFPPDVNDLPFGSWTYDRCMYQLCRIALGIVRERHSYNDIHNTLARMSHFEKELSDVAAASAPTLRDFSLCSTFQEKCQYWLFYLHRSYILCELYRPAISPGAPQTELVQRMRASCIEHLPQVVSGWLGLFKVSYLTNRSWPAMQRALSSALLLGILRETETDPSTRFLLGEFLRALEEVTAGIDTQDIWAPLQRSLFWLRKLVARSSEESSPRLPDLGSEDSPYALMDRMMWYSGLTPPDK